VAAVVLVVLVMALVVQAVAVLAKTVPQVVFRIRVQAVAVALMPVTFRALVVRALSSSDTTRDSPDG
jgi:hypothetical protein